MKNLKGETMKKAFLALLVLGMSSSAFAGEWMIFCENGRPKADTRSLEKQTPGTYVLSDKTFDDFGAADDFILANYKGANGLLSCPKK